VEALNLAEAAKVLADQASLHRKLGNSFRTGIGRLARGGFLPRLADGLFLAVVPAARQGLGGRRSRGRAGLNAIREEHPQYTYYGRVAHRTAGRCCSTGSSSFQTAGGRASTA